MKKIICIILAAVLTLNMASVVKLAAKEDTNHDENIGSVFDYNEPEEIFELGNSTLNIFQRGIQIIRNGIDYYAYPEGLKDRISGDYITTYQVYNLNYFPEILYFSVIYDSESSGIEAYHIDTKEVEKLYTHSSEITEMYCINNEYALFLSDGKLFRLSFSSCEAKEIVFDGTDMINTYIWGLVPARTGYVLISGDAGNYSIFANGFLFLDNVYHVYEDDGFLIITNNGETLQVNVEELLKYYSTHFEKKRNMFRLFKQEAGANVPTSRGGISYVGGTNGGYNDFDNEVSGTILLRDCDIYDETTLEDLFINTERIERDFINTSWIERDQLRNLNQDLNVGVNKFPDFNDPNHDSEKYDELWPLSRIESLKSYGQFLTKSSKENITDLDESARANILMNARSLIEIGWLMNGSDPVPNTWSNKEKAYNPGQLYFGLPYQQGGTYVGADCKISTFKALSETGDNNFFSVFNYYNPRNCKWYKSLKYGTDCSGFVSYALGTSHKNTEALKNSQRQILLLADNKKNGAEIIAQMQQGDFLVRDGVHCKLIAGIYRIGGEVKVVATLESRTLTTASRRNIRLYGNYDDIIEFARKYGYDASVVDNWYHDIVAKRESIDDLIAVIEGRGDGDITEGYHLYQPKERKVEHHHDCGVTVSYDGICADDLCCSAPGTENCYYINHGVLLNGAHHWDGGDPTNTSCVFCGEAIHHTYGSKESINDEKHRMYCLVCNKAINENHTFDYTYLKPKYHTVYCTDGCGFSKTEPHTIIPGTNSCACGYSICNHRYTYVIMKASGHAQRCTICGDEHETVPHNYEARQTNGAIVCSVPGAAGLLGAGTTAITDSNAGTTMGHILVCKECGYEKEGIFPHTYTLTEIIPGNSSEHRMKCECGIYVDIPHSFMIEDAVKQGCRKYCSNCGYEEYLDHDYTAYTTTKIATCTEPGQKQRTCKVCGHVRIKEIPATGHDYSKTERKEPLCKENGYERIVCTKCGDIRSETVLPYPGHDYESPVVISKATCTEPGHRTKRCKVCGFVKEYEYPQAKGHNYETKTVAATCTADGYTREVCSRCGDIRSETILTKTGHSFGEYVVTKEPTCTAKGVKTRTCSRCGQTSTKKISETGHSYGAFSVTTPASCTSTGTKSRTCAKCGHVDTEAIPMTAHKYNKKGKCKVCGAQK